jgi:hypothetical protein
MDTRELGIPDVKLIVPTRFCEERGYFSEAWSDRVFRKEVANVTFVQDNQSVSGGIRSFAICPLSFIIRNRFLCRTIEQDPSKMPLEKTDRFAARSFLLRTSYFLLCA